jgi:hypothetical protein
MSDPFGLTLFCDDIRREVNNKISLIGVYSAELVVFSPFPVSLPKLGFHIDVRFTAEQPVMDEVTLLIYLPGDVDSAPTINQVIPWKHHSQTDEELPPDVISVSNFLYSFVLSPIILKQAGFIRVRILHGEQRIRVGALEVLYRRR